MKIVYLYTELMPYNLVVFREFVKQGIEIHAFHHEKGIHKHTTYRPDHIDGVIYYKRFEYTRDQIYERIKELDPAAIIVSGWIDKDYMQITKRIKKERSIPIISTCDTQVKHTFRQWLGRKLARWLIHPSFTHIWIAGVYQYEYVKKLGFSNDQILHNHLTADIHKFLKVDIESKESKYPRNFLYVGRFIPEKGLDCLLQAWNGMEDKKGWTLTLIGNGPLKDQLIHENDNIIVKDFMSQDELLNEVKRSGCFVLPSVFEPWALVIHEFAAAGLPIICSNVCGAAPHFVINEFNGFQIKPSDPFMLRKAMENIIQCDEKKLMDMSKNSRLLSSRITPEIVSATLTGLLK